jgi:hypothetical protein
MTTLIAILLVFILIVMLAIYGTMIIVMLAIYETAEIKTILESRKVFNFENKRN